MAKFQAQSVSHTPGCPIHPCSAAFLRGLVKGSMSLCRQFFFSRCLSCICTYILRAFTLIVMGIRFISSASEPYACEPQHLLILLVQVNKQSKSLSRAFSYSLPIISSIPLNVLPASGGSVLTIYGSSFGIFPCNRTWCSKTYVSGLQVVSLQLCWDAGIEFERKW